MVTGTRSGYKSTGSLVGGSTGGTLVGKFSAAAVTIKLDFPVFASPATTILTPFPAPPAAVAPPVIYNHRCTRGIESEVKYSCRCIVIN